MARGEPLTADHGAPVRLVVPRALRRLARAMHAFGPLTPALFNVIGVGWRESVLERDLGGADPFDRRDAHRGVLLGVGAGWAMPAITGLPSACGLRC